MTPPCRVCGGQLEESSNAGIEHRAGPIRAVAQSRLSRHCANRCGDGLADAARRAIATGLVVAIPGRRSRDADRCGQCGSVLDLPLRATTRAVTIEPDAAAPFTVTLDLPVGRCPGCGCDNLPSALAVDLDVVTLSAAGVDMSMHAVVPESRRGLSEWFSRLRSRAGQRSPGPA